MINNHFTNPFTYEQMISEVVLSGEPAICPLIRGFIDGSFQ